MISLPNTTIQSAAVDPSNPGICRVTATTTHPPTGDKVTIWIGNPPSIGMAGLSGPAADSWAECPQV